VFSLLIIFLNATVTENIQVEQKKTRKK